MYRGGKQGQEVDKERERERERGREGREGERGSLKDRK